MTKRSFVFSMAVFILIVCGFISGEVKKKATPAASAQQQNAMPSAQIMIRDIAIDDIFVDANCRVWVRWKNTGNVRIDKVLRENVFIYGTSLQIDSVNHVVLEPGAVFAHGVGADPGMILSKAETVTAWIDADNVLVERNEKNNSMAKTLPCGRSLPGSG